MVNISTKDFRDGKERRFKDVEMFRVKPSRLRRGGD